MTEERLAAARRYYTAFPDEVDAIIEDNDRVARALEQELDLVIRETSD